MDMLTEASCAPKHEEEKAKGSFYSVRVHLYLRPSDEIFPIDSSRVRLEIECMCAKRTAINEREHPRKKMRDDNRKQKCLCQDCCFLSNDHERTNEREKQRRLRMMNIFLSMFTSFFVFSSYFKRYNLFLDRHFVFISLLRSFFRASCSCLFE